MATTNYFNEQTPHENNQAFPETGRKYDLDDRYVEWRSKLARDGAHGHSCSVPAYCPTLIRVASPYRMSRPRGSP